MAPRQPVAGPSRPKHSQQPIAQSPPPSSSVSGFSPNRNYFALATPVLGSADKLQVWDVASDRVIAEWEVAGASRATTVTWAQTSSSDNASKKKKRRKSGAGAGDEDVVLVTTAKSKLAVFSPSRGELVRTVDTLEPVTAAWSDEFGIVLTTASSLLGLAPDASTIAHTFPLPSTITSPTAVSILPTSTSDTLHVLVASLSVVNLHFDLSTSKTTYTSAPLPASTSSVSSIHPLPTSSQGSSFLVVSEDDRTISQYTITTSQSPAKLSYRYASPTLSSAHSLTTSSSLLSVLHESGEISLFRLPAELDLARPRSDSKPSTVKLVEGKDERTSRLCRVEFVIGDENAPGALLCGRMAGGSRVKWHQAVYELPEGGLRASTIIKCDAQDLVGSSSSSSTLPIQRFAAPAAVIESAPEDPDTEAAQKLPTDVDLADLSLGERLLALPNGGAPIANGEATPAKSKASAAGTFDGPVNAASLTRVLVQALHTSDPALLTLCLSHRNPVLIRNTIRKMPAQLALPLLKACVERLGQGKGAHKRGGGRGSVQLEQQGRGTVEWVKGVLVERGAILMTMPSLPLHLATLSQLLHTRLQLYQPLESLSGRLDLALAQITMRRIAAEQANENAKTGGQKGGQGEVYIEGESEDEDEVPIEMGEEGEVEDIDMRAGSESDDLDEEDSDEDEDGEDDEEDPLESGSENEFLDLEAEESGSGDEDEDDESDEE